MTPAESSAYGEQLRVIAIDAGLDRIGFASAEPFAAARLALDERKAAGLHGGMQFTYRNPARSTEPSRALASVRTLVVGAYAYPTDVTDPDDVTRSRGALGRVARYATADHYAVLRSGLEAVAARLRADGWVARVILDDNALVDRAAAVRAGLGWFGKNANVLLAGSGSWCVLGSVLTDAELPVAGGEVADGCGGCTRCLDGCPTGAIVAPGVVDARRCLAWLVQAEGVFPPEHRVALGDRLYGCDVCQEVCPPSIRSTRIIRDSWPTGPGPAPGPSPPAWTPIALRTAGAPPSAAAPIGAWVPVLDLLAASDDELLSVFGRWYIPRRDPLFLRRNALVVLGNVAPVPADAAVRAALVGALEHPSELVRGHAIWAARRLACDDLLVAVAADPSTLVQAELAADVPTRAGSRVKQPSVPPVPGVRAR